MKHSCYLSYHAIAAIVLGIIEILLKMDFYNDFLK